MRNHPRGIIWLLPVMLLAACVTDSGTATPVPPTIPSAPTAATVNTGSTATSNSASPVATTRPQANVACPVTPFTTSRPPDANTAGFTQTWYGNDVLWAGLAPSYQGKWFVGSLKVLWWRSVTGQLTIEGKRLDGPAPPLAATIPSGYGENGYQATGMDFPTTGCWEVVGKVANRELRFTVSVYPDGCLATSLRDPDSRPTPIPCTSSEDRMDVCPVTQPPNPSLTPPPPITDRVGSYGFWYGNDALWVVLAKDGTTPGGKFGWWRTAHGQLTIEGRRLDAPAPPLDASIPSGYGDTGFQVSGLDFPTTGCWEVMGKVADKQLIFVVNVAPPPR